MTVFATWYLTSRDRRLNDKLEEAIKQTKSGARYSTFTHSVIYL